MNGHTHRVFAAVTVLSLGHATDYPTVAVLTATAAALVTAGGVLSPDVDQFKAWRAADTLLPDESIGGPLGHRQLTHWWGLPVIAYAATVSLTGPAAVIVHGLILGYAAHIALDAIWGRPGVPVGPWWWYAGVSARNDSLSAVLATAVFAVVSAWLTVTLALNLPADPRWLLP